MIDRADRVQSSPKAAPITKPWPAIIVVVALVLAGLGLAAPPTRAAPGDISTIAGGAGVARPNDIDAMEVGQRPRGVAVHTSAAGTVVYIADEEHHVVRALKAGREQIVAGTGSPGINGDGGPATSGQLNTPKGVAVDSAGNLYIADSGNQRVRQVSPLGTMRTLAGTGVASNTGDGNRADQASLLNPVAVAVDSAGNVFVATKGNSNGFGGSIRKVEATPRADGHRYIDTVVGCVISVTNAECQGVALPNAQKTDALDLKLRGPDAVAIGPDGTVYLADTKRPGTADEGHLSRILRRESSGGITMVAGNDIDVRAGPQCPTPDETPAVTPAPLCDPLGLAVGANGAVYFSETKNIHRVRRVEPAIQGSEETRRITTVVGTGAPGFAGDGLPASAALLHLPTGLALGADGALYVADSANYRLRRVDPGPTRTITTVAGNGLCCFGGDGGPANGAQLASPSGVALDASKNMFVADSANHRVRRIDDVSKITTTLAGTGTAGYITDGGPADEAPLNNPMGVASDADGSVYIADTGNNRVRKVLPDGTITTAAGSGAPGRGATPDVAMPAAAVNLDAPAAVAVAPDGRLYIADTGNNRLRMVDPNSEQITTVAEVPGAAGVALAPDGTIYVSSASFHQVHRIVRQGDTFAVQRVAGSSDGTSGSSGDGNQAATSKLNQPRGLAVDPDGVLYIADSANHRVRRVDAAGVINTVAGTGIAGFSGDGGSASAARLNSPSGLAADAFNLYIADRSNNRVRAVASGAPPPPPPPPPPKAMPGCTRDLTPVEPRSDDVAGPTGPGRWTATNGLCSARSGHTATRLLDGRVLVAGGEGPGADPTLASAEIFDPATMTWSATESMTLPRTAHTATLLDGAICADNGSPVPTWCDKVLVTGGRAFGSVDGGGVAAGGWSDPFATAELFDPETNSWTPTGQSMAAARAFHTATVLDDPVVCAPQSRPSWCGKVLIDGDGEFATELDRNTPGRIADGEDDVLAGAELYNPDTNLFEAAPTGGTPRRQHTATPVGGGKVLLAGGLTEWGMTVKSAQLYDPAAVGAAGPWSQVSDLVEPRRSHSAAALPGGRALIVGGLGEGGRLSSAEVYEPATRAWRATGAMREPRTGDPDNGSQAVTPDEPFTATAMPDGTVLVAGGGSTCVRLDDCPVPAMITAEVFDLGAGIVDSSGATVGAFRPTGSMLSDRVVHTATLLNSGLVLVVGGRRRMDGVWFRPDSELYDPAATLPAPSVMAIEPRGGPPRGGTRVVITGVGFGPEAVPRFDGISAPYFRLESPTRMVATAPPHDRGPVDVTVTTPAGTSVAIERLQFSYGNWTGTGAMKHSRRGHTATTLDDGTVLVTGGIGGSGTLYVNELYQPDIGVWRITGALRAARARHSIALLGATECSATNPPSWCGGVLVTGGQDGSVVLNSAERYLLGPGNWTSAGVMASARVDHSSTNLADGSVVVAGGVDGSGVVQPSAERYVPQSDTWRAAGSLSTARTGHAAVGLGPDRVLVVGGTDGAGRPLATAERWDAQSGWRNMAAMETPRATPTATVLKDGRVLVTGGGSDSAEVYDPVGDTWTGTKPMLAARQAHTASLLENGKVMVAGGRAPGGLPLDSTEMFSPDTLTWTAGDPLLGPRASHAATVIDGGVPLVVGGNGYPLEHHNNTLQNLVSAELFLEARRARPMVGALNPPAGPTYGNTEVSMVGYGLYGPSVKTGFGELGAKVTFASETEVVAVSPAQPQGAVAVGLEFGDGRVLDPSPASRFTYAAGTWSATTPLNQRRWGHSATLLDGRICAGASRPTWCGRVLVTGGASPAGNSSESELYEPETATWSRTGPMSAAHNQHTAIALDAPACGETSPPQWCGRVLVVGEVIGLDGAGAVPELYDPATGSWSNTGPLRVPKREFHTTTLLGDGRVLVTGGYTGGYGFSGRSSEIYDPAGNSWSATADLLHERAYHSATTLADGRVLVVGGHGPRATSRGHGETLGSAEMYDPVSGIWTETTALKTGRFAHSATILDGPGCVITSPAPWCGDVLVAGGVVSREFLQFSPLIYSPSVEIYDVATERWVPTRSLPEARAGHSATLLPNGTLLVAGRAAPITDESGPAPLSTAVLYDPVADRWSRTGSMASARGLHTATLLGGAACRIGSGPAPWCGSVLAVGGSRAIITQDGPPLASSELYKPVPTLTAISPPKGPAGGGKAIAIEGRGFTADAVLAVDGIRLEPRQFTVDSPTRITAVLPPHAPGVVQITLENAAGSSATMAPDPTARFTYLGLPGGVNDLAAEVMSDTEVALRFSAPAVVGGGVARRFDIRFSRSGIGDEGQFERAREVCAGSCVPQPGPGRVGDAVSFSVRGLRPGTTYSFALRALSEDGAGGISNAVVATTTGVAPPCDGSGEAGPGQVAYPAGYSLVGVPQGTRLAADAPLYSWFDLGRGGAYLSSPVSTELEGGHGYWAWFRCPRVVDLGPGGPQTLRLPLGSYRASMVGNPSSTGDATVTGHDFAARWDPEANGGDGGYEISGYREPQTLGVGEGTWVFSYVPTEVELRGP